MMDHFFLAKTLIMKISRRMSSIKAITVVFILFQTLNSYGQGCDCPPINSCGTCMGGLTSLTLRFNGSVAANITASDQLGLVFSGVVVPGSTFTFGGTLVNEKFAGTNVEIRVDGVVDTFIAVGCASGVMVGSTFGSFTIKAGLSKSGGALCCAASSIETVPPTISNCPTSIISNLPANGCTATVTWTPPTASDNCTLQSLTSTHLPGTSFAPGNTLVTYTATDIFGNSSTCSFTVAVNDVTKPVFSGCPTDISVSAVSSCDVVATWTAPTATDNCSVIVVSNHNPGDAFPVGTTLVTYTATDPSGNKATCSFKVIVTDDTSPVFTNCVNDLTIATNSCTAVATWTAPAATDNCTATVSSSHSPGAAFPLGTTLVTYTATDVQGNKSTCTFNVIVTNTGNPVVTGCPSDLVFTADETEEVNVNWDEPQATVQCGEIVVTKSHEPGSIFPIGTTRVTYTFSEQSGRDATCGFNVTVLEPEVELDISKAVTPDGDGINDRWQLTNIEKFKNNTVVIVDRWGNKIFSAEGYDNENVVWSGMRENGTKVPTGTYFYTIEVQLRSMVVRKKGYLEVIQ